MNNFFGPMSKQVWSETPSDVGSKSSLMDVHPRRTKNKGPALSPEKRCRLNRSMQHPITS